MASPLVITWKEIVDSRSPASVQAGWNETRAVLIGNTDWSNISDFTAFKSILGFPARITPDAPATPYISRILPMQHPYLPWLYATKITSVQGLAPTGKVQTPRDPYASYTKARLTVVFETLPFPVLSDAAVNIASPSADEWSRYVEKYSFPNVEQITRPGANFKYANGPPANTPFNQGITIRTQKINLKWIWRQVPHLSLFTTTDPNATIPQTIAGLVGTVNNQSYHGFPRGTLLMMPPKLTPITAPISPTSLGLPAGNPPRCWDVELNIVYFNPPTDPTPSVIYPTFGHQLFPPAPNSTTQYWYLGSRDGGNPPNANNNGAWLYQETNWSPLLQSI